jgi:HEAT repeat protein
VVSISTAFLEIILGEGDASTRAVTEAKLLDSMGSALAPVLIKQLRVDGLTKAQRVRLASMLRRVANERHEVVLLELIAEESETDVENQLARTLERVCSARSAERLAGELDNENRVVRSLAARTLGRLGVAASTAPLSAHLGTEKDAGVKAEVERALAALTNPGPVVQIVDAALGQDDAGRIAALEGLSVLARGELAREILAEAQHDSALYTRFLGAIGEHGAEAGVPLLVIALESERVELRSEAIKLLLALTGKSHGFDANGPADTRRVALRRWAEWVEELVQAQ